MKLYLAFLISCNGVAAFAPNFLSQQRSVVSTELDMSKVGIFFGTSTGSTETVADMIAEEFGDDVEGPIDVETIDGSVKAAFEKYDALIVGTPTWNTGADSERSGTGWDELYYGPMQDFQMQGKKVAVFGLGDQISYSENYADATGELHDVFQNLGCQMIGYTSQEGYEHDDSKAIRAGKFCGLLCDMVNQEEMSEERVQKWVAQLKAEGLLEGGSVSSTPAAASPEVEVKAVSTLEELESHSELLDATIENHATEGFKAYVNPVSKRTMWVSSDGRSCYYTTDSTAVKTTAASP